MTQLLSTSVIGAGPMGRALARRLSERGTPVTVWNRTRAAADKLAEFGIAVADTPAGAFNASEMTIVCVANHAAALEVVRNALGSGASFDGRLIIEMSSSTPDEARRLYAENVAHGAEALDANILCFPEHIGSSEALFVVAGPRAAWERGQRTLRELADCRYAGQDPGAARVVAKTAASVYFTSHSAFAEAFAAAIALGADPETVLHASLVMNRLAGEGMRMTAEEFSSDRSVDVEVRMATRVEDAKVGYETIRSGGMPGMMIGAARELMAKAVEAGRGDEEMTALVEVLLASRAGGG